MNLISRALAALFGVALAVGPIASAAQDAAGTPSSAPQHLVREIDDLVRQSVNEWEIRGLSVSVVQGGEVLLAAGYGVRNEAGDPVTPDTRFPLASLNKAFTAVGVGLLVDDGLVTFEKPVVAYLPDFRMPDNVATSEVTLSDILSHQTGLAGFNDMSYYRAPQISPEELVSRIPYFAMHARPRGSYQYSNAAYIIAGQVIEKVSGKAYETFMAERLFAPLAMTRTGFLSAEELERSPDHATGLRYWQGRAVHEIYDGGRIINAHGGMSSTARDMAQWMLFNLHGRAPGEQPLILRRTLATIHSTGVPLSSGEGLNSAIGYGLGWNTQLYRGERALFHNGALDSGIRTATFLLPGRSIGVTILSNESTSLPDLLVLEIADRLMGVDSGNHLDRFLPSRKAALISRTSWSPTAAPEETAPPRPLPEYAGRYVHPGYGEITVSVSGDRLATQYNGHTSMLSHRAYEIFPVVIDSPVNGLPGTLQFLSNFTGEVTGLRYSQLGASVFEKQPDARMFDAEVLQKLVGRYGLGEVVISISRRGSQLVYQRDQQDPAILQPGLDGAFHHPRAPELRFSFEPEGTTGAALIRNDGRESTRYTRIN